MAWRARSRSLLLSLVVFLCLQLAVAAHAGAHQAHADPTHNAPQRLRRLATQPEIANPDQATASELASLWLQNQTQGQEDLTPNAAPEGAVPTAVVGTDASNSALATTAASANNANPAPVAKPGPLENQPYLRSVTTHLEASNATVKFEWNTNATAVRVRATLSEKMGWFAVVFYERVRYALVVD